MRATTRLRRLRASGIELGPEEGYADLLLDLPKAAVAEVANRFRNT